MTGNIQFQNLSNFEGFYKYRKLDNDIIYRVGVGVGYSTINGTNIGAIGFNLYSSEDNYQKRLSNLLINAEKGIVFSDNEKSYYIFGAHNKPISTYKGNGSSATRTIETSGYGNVCVVYGNGYSSLVTLMGAITYHYQNSVAIQTIVKAEIYFYNGILYLNSTNSAINKSDVTYSYQVL